MDAQAKQAQIANEATRIANQKEVDFARIQAEMSKQENTNTHQRSMENSRLQLDAAKTAAQIAAQKNQSKGNK